MGSLIPSLCMTAPISFLFVLYSPFPKSHDTIFTKRYLHECPALLPSFVQNPGENLCLIAWHVIQAALSGFRTEKRYLLEMVCWVLCNFIFKLLHVVSFLQPTIVTNIPSLLSEG